MLIIINKLINIEYGQQVAIQFIIALAESLMNFTDQITSYIIRPTRQKYHINRLGPKQHLVNIPGHPAFMVLRDDFSVVNRRNQKIVYSFYNNFATKYPDVCVVYLHANNGSRVEGLHYLQPLLQGGFNVCLLDFSGSGLSDGEFITLGPNETQDLVSVYEDMKLKKGILRMILWGRSMGACTALMYAYKYPNNVIAMVLDSPFKDLRKLVKQIASERTGLPKIFFDPILNLVDRDLSNKIGHRFEQYKIKKYINQNENALINDRKLNQNIIPSLFLASEMDKLVKCHHVEKLYTRYPGSPGVTKKLYYIKNQHHENRDLKVIEKCVTFINTMLEQKNRYFHQQHLSNANNREVPTQFRSYNQMVQQQQIANQSQNISFKTQKTQTTQSLVRPQSSLTIFNKFNPYFCFGEIPSKKDQVTIENNYKRFNKKNYPQKINLSKNNIKFAINQSQVNQSYINEFNDHQRLSAMILSSYKNCQPSKFKYQLNQNFHRTLNNSELSMNGNSQNYYQSVIKYSNKPNSSMLKFNQTTNISSQGNNKKTLENNLGQLSTAPTTLSKDKKIGLNNDRNCSNAESPTSSVNRYQCYNNTSNKSNYQSPDPVKIEPIPIMNGNNMFQSGPVTPYNAQNGFANNSMTFRNDQFCNNNIDNFNLARTRQSAQYFQSSKQSLNKNKSIPNVEGGPILLTARNIDGNNHKISLAKLGFVKNIH